MLTRTLRAIAHHNGCSLMFTSNQHKEHLNKIVSPLTTPYTVTAAGRTTRHRSLASLGLLCSLLAA